MKKGLTFIGFVMDRSGSMGSMAVEASNAFNNFISDQKEVEGEALVTFVEFDNNYNVVHDAVDINTIVTDPEDDARYQLVPGGTTALLDAIGISINSIGERLAGMPEEERPEKVIIGIMTDGMENASHEFTRDQIKSMIEKQESEFSWTFMFFGANQDAFAAGAGLGVAAGNAANFAGTGKGAISAMSNVSRAVTAYRNPTYDMHQKDNLVQDNADASGETSN